MRHRDLASSIELKLGLMLLLVLSTLLVLSVGGRLT